MQLADPFSEIIVTDLLTFTFSTYVPSLTTIVSPGDAALIACWTVG